MAVAAVSKQVGGIATRKIAIFWWKRKRNRGSGSGGISPKTDRFQNPDEREMASEVAMEIDE